MRSNFKNDLLEDVQPGKRIPYEDIPEDFDDNRIVSFTANEKGIAITTEPGSISPKGQDKIKHSDSNYAGLTEQQLRELAKGRKKPVSMTPAMSYRKPGIIGPTFDDRPPKFVRYFKNMTAKFSKRKKR
ncbi:MAG: hypothetical protein MUD00_00220 [Candidatus Pacebacteria bacterium]|jgi:hypothetical protein|nr:hypothetical protein [Candidatus Paceibacterota bacterium]